MKKNIFRLLFVLAVCASALTSCNTDAEGALYSSGDKVDVAFASTQQNVDMVASDNGKIKITVYRGNSSSAVSVPVTLDKNTLAGGIFALENSKVEFKAGENIAYAVLNYGNFDKISPTSQYSITLSIADSTQLSPSEIDQITIKAQRKLTWKSIGASHYYSSLFGDWDQPVEKADEGNIYRLSDCITKDYPLIFALTDDGQNLASYAIQPTGYKNATYGMVYYVIKAFSRDGNRLNFQFKPCVIYNGKYAQLFDTTQDYLDLP
ncbi:hypothetical protein [uncultured Bacteroides sp.]|uniref:hypothetical protein n=1 Tax=uncultured Bacteroides sp. TaxID=162156 RepID=UPI002AAA77E3|nr:hypothetical protein [uncultured Bacteroides sp.]